MPKIPPGPKKILLNGVEVGEVMSTGDLDKDADSVIQFLKSKGHFAQIGASPGAVATDTVGISR